MKNFDFRYIVSLLIGIYFLYKFIGKPFIGLFTVLSNVLNVINLKKMNTECIIQIPEQEKEKRNFAEIFSLVLLFLIFLLFLRSIYVLAIIAGLLTIAVELITPRIYKKINGIYSTFIVCNKKILYEKIHSWKKIESNKTISFLGLDGLRFDVYMGNNYETCINFLIEKKLREEI